MSVHPTSIVDPSAELASGVRVGPYAVIGPGVVMGPGCVVEAHVVVEGPSRIGADNHFFPFCTVGLAPQRREPAARHGALEMGRGNVVREHASLHRGAEGPTSIGDGNLFMAGSHVGHDAVVGSGCTLANGVAIAGHVTIEDHATFGGLSAVAQRLRVGEGAFVAGGSMCERDVVPFVIVEGNRARVRALNEVGLERRGVAAEDVAALRRAFRAIYVQKTVPVLVAARAHDDPNPLVRRLVAAILRS